MDPRQLEPQAELLKALAHPVRLCIVRGLLDGECNVGHIQDCLGLPQSTISNHLAVLRSKGILRAERRGIQVCYSVADRRAGEIVQILVDRQGVPEEGNRGGSR